MEAAFCSLIPFDARRETAGTHRRFGASRDVIDGAPSIDVLRRSSRDVISGGNLAAMSSRLAARPN
jgi:hypothetical protein